MGVFDLSPMADSPSPRSVPTSDQPGRPCVYEPPASCSQDIITLQGPPRPPPSMPRIPSSQNIITLEGPPRPPSMPRIPMLPTPQMTPQSSIAPTPAASAGGNGPRRPSICTAMSQAQNMCMARSTLDQRPPALCRPGSVDGFPAVVRRSSLARSTSSASSPESMVSDVSTLSSRSSRSSSISSNSSGSFSSSQPRLAVKAALRNTNNSLKENRKPLTIVSPIDEGSHTGIYSSPETYTGPSGQVPDFSNFSLETPSSFSSSAHEAAQGLCELSRPQGASQATEQRNGRKRGRTNSEDMILQNHVRYLINLGASAERSVLSDSRLAKSFLIPESSRSQCSLTQLPPIKPVELSGPAGMKRACCGSEARKIALNPTMRAEYLN